MCARKSFNHSYSRETEISNPRYQTVDSLWVKLVNCADHLFDIVLQFLFNFNKGFLVSITTENHIVLTISLKFYRTALWLKYLNSCIHEVWRLLTTLKRLKPMVFKAIKLILFFCPGSKLIFLLFIKSTFKVLHLESSSNLWQYFFKSTEKNILNDLGKNKCKKKQS